MTWDGEPCRLCASRAASEDTVRRREASVREREVSADNVRTNADKRVSEMWTALQLARGHIAGLMGVVVEFALGNSKLHDATYYDAEEFLERDAFSREPTQPKEEIDGT